MDWIWWLIWYAVIGTIAGYAAHYLLQVKSNPLLYISVGLVGGIIGGFIFEIVKKLIEIGSSILTASIGALLVIMLLRYWQNKKLIEE